MNNTWENRIKQNKRKRELELKRHAIQIIIFTFIAIFAIIFTTSFVSKAADDDEIYFKYYTTITLHSGDTLSSLANQFSDEIHYSSINDYINEVVYMNHLDNADDINVGEHLILPYFSKEYKR